MNCNFATLEGDLQRAVIEITEEEEAVWIPRAELEAYGHDVVVGSARQLQEARGVEKDREGVRIHAGERQVKLLGHKYT